MMKKILVFVLTLSLVLMTATVGVYADPGNGRNMEFKDIKGNWGYASIMKMQDLGILLGYEDGTFRPDQTLTQEEVAVILERLVQKKFNLDDDDEEWDDDDEEWDDDDDDMAGVPGWAKKAMERGVKHQYINMNRYHSQVQCDRLLVAVALAKALDLEPVDPDDFDDNPFNFGDRKLISDEDYGYLLALYNTGYLKGYPDGNFNPNYLMSRAQMAALIDKIMNDGEVDPDDDVAPVWPVGSKLTASAITSDSVKLQWTAATDAEGVTQYRINYLDDGAQVKYANLTRSVTITGLEPDEDYTFTVYARDAAGNWSLAGPSEEVTTLEEEDLIQEAIDEVNDADTTAEMHTALTTNAAVLGLSLTDYNALLDKTSVLEDMLDQTFDDLEELQDAFEDAVNDAEDEE